MLSALADGELSADQLARVHQHLAECPQCTSAALTQSLLKSAAGRAGQRYALPRKLGERLAHLASQEGSRRQGSHSADAAARSPRGAAAYAWVAAAAVLLVCVSLPFVARNARRDLVASSESAGLVTEVCDQHIATLAANSPPEVISSDRHTVKPWFQGRIPFSFNLPENLPADTTLDGANPNLPARPADGPGFCTVLASIASRSSSSRELTAPSRPTCRRTAPAST